MKRALLGLIFLAISFNSWATHKSLELVVNVPFTTPNNAKIYLAGNIPGECYWVADCLELEKIGPHTYRTYINFPFKQPSFQFKVTRGTWDSQGAYSNGSMNRNMHIQLNIESMDNLQREVFTVKNWLDQGAYKVEGELIRYTNFYSPQLDNKREVVIWLPMSYRSGEKKHYPVIYMHDGQNVFDINTASFGNEWNVDEVMTGLIKNNEIREAIIVASSSGLQRNAEYSDNRKGKLYGKFLVETLKPFVDAEFRTQEDRDNTYLMGSSMGALISFSILWRHPEVFSKAAGLSFPAHGHDNMIFKFLEEFKVAPLNTSFYVDHGGKGQDADYTTSVEKFVYEVTNILELPAKQIPYHVFPYADHTEVDWARRVHLPLKFLLND
jgi:predicted alpha/beta superfamily hydrolase